MSHLSNTTKTRKDKHLNYKKRIKIEALSKAGLKSEAIAKQIGCSGRTVRLELAKGRTESLNSDYTTRIEYSAEIGQKKHDYNATAKGQLWRDVIKGINSRGCCSEGVGIEQMDITSFEAVERVISAENLMR